MNQLQLIINAVAVLNSFILFSLLVFRKNNTLPNYALGGIILIPGLYFSNSIIMLNGWGIHYYLYFIFVQFIAIFYTPFTSIYVYSIMGKSITKLWPVFVTSALLGLIPCYILYHYLHLNINAQIDFFHRLTHGTYPDIVTIYSIFYYSIQQVVFIFLLIEIRKMKKRFTNALSNLDSIKLEYLDHLMLLLVLANALIILLYLAFNILFAEYILLPLIATAIYSFVVRNAFKNNVIFTSNNYQLHLQKVEKNKPISTAESTFDDELKKELVKKIELLLQNKTVLQDCELTISKFSNELNTPSHIVSKYLNDCLQQNFHDLINSHRIEYAKKLIKNNPLLTIESIAYDAGFNSRATFYRAFKKHTHQTPTEFINSLKAN